MRRRDAGRAAEDSGKCGRRHDARACEPLRASDSLAATQLRRTGVTIGAVRQGATGKTLRRVSKATAARGMTSHKAATARAVMKYEQAIQRIRILRCRVHAMRPGTMIVHLWAQIAVADPPQCRWK